MARAADFCRAAHRKLHHEDGDAEHHQKDQVHEHESGAAVLARDVRETPDVAQAAGAAGRNEDEAQSGRETLARGDGTLDERFVCRRMRFL